MGLQDVEVAISIAQSRRDSHFVGGRTEDLIERAEAQLGFAFPPTYRRFLHELGAGFAEGVEVFGVIHDDWELGTIPNAVWLTLTERRESGLPKTLLLFFGFDDGTYLALDSAQPTVAGEYPVVTWAPFHPELEGEVVASDFGTWYADTVRAASVA